MLGSSKRNTCRIRLFVIGNRIAQTILASPLDRSYVGPGRIQVNLGLGSSRRYNVLRNRHLLFAWSVFITETNKILHCFHQETLFPPLRGPRKRQPCLIRKRHNGVRVTHCLGNDLVFGSKALWSRSGTLSLYLVELKDYFFLRYHTMKLFTVLRQANEVEHSWRLADERSRSWRHSRTFLKSIIIYLCS